MTGALPLLMQTLPAVTPRVLAWRPFLDPLPADHLAPLFLLPLVILVSVVYKALREDKLQRVPRQARYLVLQVMAFLVGSAVLLALLARWF